MTNDSTSNNGIGFVGLLTVAFIVLKLTGVIAWSWWWVLAPVWITSIFVVVICVAVLAIAASKWRAK